MKEKPKVSILINNYNYERFLQEAIDSALNQTYSHTEVIVVDDGSTDNSQKIIASYGDKIIPVLKSNGGQASAFNAGFAASQGDILCFLDSDDLCLPEKVAEVVDAFGSCQDLGWCFHSLKWVDSSLKTHIDKSKYEKPPTTKNGDQEPKREYDLRAHIRKGKLRDKLPSLPSTSGLCFKRSLLQQILPMPEATTIGLNDAYLEFTAIGLSKGIILDKKLGLYRLHGANAYVMSKEKQQVQGKILILTAYWIRDKFPDLSKFTNNVFAAGLGAFWRAGGVQSEYQEFVRGYLSSVTPLEKVEIHTRAFYNRLKKL